MKGDARNQAATTITRDRHKHQKSFPGTVVHAGEHVVQVLAHPGYEHEGHVDEDEKEKPTQHDEMDRPGNLSVNDLRKPAKLVGDSRALHQAGDYANGAAMNTVMKYVSCCRPL